MAPDDFFNGLLGYDPRECGARHGERRTEAVWASRAALGILGIVTHAQTVQFHMAILDGDVDRVRKMLSASPDLVARRWTPQRFTPLSQAVVHCDEVIFALLLEHGADPKETYDRGSSLLHTAAYSGSVPIARLLLELGLDVNGRDERGTTPLCIARESDRDPMARFLIEHGAEP